MDKRGKWITGEDLPADFRFAQDGGEVFAVNGTPFNGYISIQKNMGPDGQRERFVKYYSGGGMPYCTLSGFFPEASQEFVDLLIDKTAAAMMQAKSEFSEMFAARRSPEP